MLVRFNRTVPLSFSPSITGINNATSRASVPSGATNAFTFATVVSVEFTIEII
jgi:hypothetical protein